MSKRLRIFALQHIKNIYITIQNMYVEIQDNAILKLKKNDKKKILIFEISIFERIFYIFAEKVIYNKG